MELNEAIDATSDVLDTTEVTDGVTVGSLADVKEQKFVVPAATGVKFFIKSAEIRNTTREGELRARRVINLSLYIEDGIGEEGKFKNKPMFIDVVYFNDPKFYSDKEGKVYYKSLQNIVDLKFLALAVGVDLASITTIPYGVTEESAIAIAQAAEKKYVTANILVDDEVKFDEATKNWTKTGGKVNKVKGYQAVDASGLV